ncbi:TetR family transcriptional regulator [Acidovorax sp. SUPP2522]|uniref:TetR/AcrR family transcriptional regulator n=1 Tax=unclassified Acidovorax TaxID=2684926 RepID=UPI00234B4FCE|nr:MULTISPECIES: TetR/AcrR family transcriptional regulator [unclassified Acidovorax]WCN00030.1 TetR/AcrR family transcriptional regulator [Acidovorax sp. GBBC 1281]GKT19113.1 TetR family transcriptional regulator [Acidovorax sp. SUPP2522]
MNDQPHHPHRLPPAERGRNQDSSRDELIINATLELLAAKGYHGLTMTDVAALAGVSKATLYRRWTAKPDLVADAVATLDSLNAPRYPGTSLRDDLLALVHQAGSCDDRPEIVTATMEMARSNPELYRTLVERYSTFIRAELAKMSARASDAGYALLSEVELDVLADTVIALLAHYGGPTGTPVPSERLIKIVDHLLMVLITGSRTST